jgi:uncharacterized protein (TIGR00255 family)
MINSMTGCGFGTFSENGVTATVEIRSINSRFNEIILKTPKILANKENDIKSIIRENIGRGKITLTICFDKELEQRIPLKINTEVVKAYIKLIKDLKKVAKISEPIKLPHLLNYPEIFEYSEEKESDKIAWQSAEKALNIAILEIIKMRADEGSFLLNDLQKRNTFMQKCIEKIETIAKDNVPIQKQKLMDRVQQIIGQNHIDESRIELEIALLADKIDITEECIRFKSHINFFEESLHDSAESGKKLNFLIQEMNREINTITSKADNVEISHIAISVKEELEKIREQLQNIE